MRLLSDIIVKDGTSEMQCAVDVVTERAVRT